MNILVVYINAVDPVRGGTERVSYTVAEALKKKGHSVYFLATHATAADKRFEQQKEYFLIDSQVSYEERKQKIIEICRDLCIDVVINECAEFGLGTILSNKVLKGTKVISCTHLDIYGLVKYFHRPNPVSRIKRGILSFLAFFGIYPHYIKHYIMYKKIFREVVHGSDAVVAVTPIIAEQIKQFVGVKSDKITSILNPLTSDSLQPFYDAAAKEKVLLYVGRLSHTKNVDLILKSWNKIAAQYPEWSLEIAGEGDEKSRLVSLVERNRIPRVRFHGQVSNLAPLYSRAEYLLLASDSESFSCVVLESMAYGCHPIVFDYPSAPIVIPNPQLGTRVKRHSCRAFARTVANAISSGVTNRDVMHKVAEHLSQFDMDKLVLQWLALLEQIQISPEHD